jgi:nucleotide-binding universal stress UspA family protein
VDAPATDAMSDAAKPNSARQSILVCYDGSPGAARAVDAAAELFPGRPAIVLYVSSRVAAQHVRTTSVPALRDELIEEVRVAARREAAAIAEDGARLARRAGLEARPRVVEAGDSAGDAIVRVAMEESAAAVVVGRPGRARLARRTGSVSRSVLDHCPLPVVVI